MQPTNGFQWFLAAIKKYAVFNGRSRRREFWYFVLFRMLVVVAADILDRLLGVGQLFNAVATLGLLLPTIAVGVRRMHDTNRSGWWSLLPIANIVFWAQDSDAFENRFGPCPKPASEMPGAAFARSAIDIGSLDQIEKLACLRDNGALTPDEFQKMKAALL